MVGKQVRRRHFTNREKYLNVKYKYFIFPDVHNSEWWGVSKDWGKFSSL